jgi:hypothetical protein
MFNPYNNQKTKSDLMFLIPEPLFNSRPSSEWWVKIADCGISKRIEDGLGGLALLRSTLGYIAPELCGLTA